MLSRLIIKNYAIIDELDIGFSDKLNIITGETGAGKSIILGALSLILGHRADSKALFRQKDKCVIEGYFSIGNYQIEDFFKENDLDYDANSVIRREITPDGKSRSFINDTPVNLTLLKDLGEQLVDIHSQHETLELNSDRFQLLVVDSFCRHEELLERYRSDFKRYKQLSAEYKKLTEQSVSSKNEEDYLRFQYDELEEARILADEQETLEQELLKLTHAEDIRRNLDQSLHFLSEDEAAVHSRLKDTIQTISSIEKYSVLLQSLNERLKSTLIELKDIVSELEQLAQDTVIDPMRANELNERLNLIYKLQQKHRVSTNADLLSVQEIIRTKLQGFDSTDERLAAASLELTSLKEELNGTAAKISANREKMIPSIEQEVNTVLQEVGLPDARFQISIQELPFESFNISGKNSIRFLFSANKGFDLTELSKVASGGELSRLMLCLKGLTARYAALPTIIFDEIDSGVSGEIALKVGNSMQKLTTALQVIAITHLPQIASKGRSHFFVYKEDKGEYTVTNIRKLEEQERVIEIAKMLSGDNPSATAIENAKELLYNMQI